MVQVRAVRAGCLPLAARLHSGPSLRGGGIGISELVRLDEFHGLAFIDLQTFRLINGSSSGRFQTLGLLPRIFLT
jgi:hypothetical protein